MAKKKTGSGRSNAPTSAAKKPAPKAAADVNAGTPPRAAGSGGTPTPDPAARLPFRRPQSLNFAGVGRNDICPCGSGKRFKNCHGH